MANLSSAAMKSYGPNLEHLFRQASKTIPIYSNQGIKHAFKRYQSRLDRNCYLGHSQLGVKTMPGRLSQQSGSSLHSNDGENRFSQTEERLVLVSTLPEAEKIKPSSQNEFITGLRHKSRILALLHRTAKRLQHWLLKSFRRTRA